MANTIVRIIRLHAEERADKIWWRSLSGPTAREITFGQLFNRASAFAHCYIETGVKEGETVLIFLPHCADATAAFVGAMLMGAIPSFMPCPSAKQHPSIYWRAHRDLLRRIGPSVLLSDQAHATQMQQCGLADLTKRIIVIEKVAYTDASLPDLEVDEGAVALLQHSSGTTGLKKGVALSHRAILRQVEAYSHLLGMQHDDTIVTWLPLYHDMGLIACTIMPLILGQTVTALDPFEWVSRPVSLFEAVRLYDGAFVWMPNFAFEHLARTVPDDYAGDLSCVKAFIDCSEPCKPETFDRFHTSFRRLGVRREQLQTCYAMAETVFAVSQTPPGYQCREICVDTEHLRRVQMAIGSVEGKGTKILSNGCPLPGLTVRIQNEWGYDLPDNAIGEVVLSGDFLFEGYFNDPETTNAHLANGHYKTRDRGFMRDGELYVLGRNDDLIIVNGRNLYAHEVEALVSSVQGIRPGRAVAFGTFNSMLGSQELIVVAEREHATSAISGQSLGLAVRDAVYDNTGIEIRSTYIVDPGWLVKTTSGKISREENQAKYLRESETTIVRSSEAFPLTGDTLDTLARIIEKEFDYPAQRVQRSTVANDVEGWDSLAHASLILTVEKMFGIHFVDSEIFGLSCVGDLADRCDWLIANSDTSSQKEERTIYESKHASILRMGQRQPSHTHDIIVFAGIAKKFAGTGLLDFASTFLETEARDTCKYFVTDHVKDWYVSCFDEVAAKLNQLSNSPKIFIGNSMGGYASLKFAEAVMNVIAVLAFVPHSIANPSNIKADSSEKWKVNFVPGVRYCILFGENEDAVHREYIQRQVSDKSRQRIVIVPGCGHMLVPYLNQRKFLAPILESCMRPETMGDDVEEIVSRMIKARKL